MSETTMPSEGFDSTGVAPVILAALTQAGFVIPTPIQAKTIPVALAGEDVIGIAETGTGKTMAFALPIISRLLANHGERALIIVPTRELALQVEQSIRTITRLLQPALRTVSLIGGMPIYRQIKELKMHPAIFVATPGRLKDHLQQGTIDLSKVTVLVLDEADRMLDMGFAPQIKEVCETIPKGRQTLLFSATFAPEIARLAANYQNNPVRIEVAKAGTAAAQIKQELCYVKHDEKLDLLATILQKHEGTVLIFSRTKHGTTKLARSVQTMGYSTTEMHSNRSQYQRKQALEGFKTGRYRVLVATDVAARGIDVKDISMVINFDLPDAAEDYVHRIGRTGRAGKSGLAISFATPDQQRDVRGIERHMNRTLPISEYSIAQPYASTGGYSSGGYRSGGSGGGNRPQRRYSSLPSTGGFGSSSSRPSSGSGYGSSSNGSSSGSSSSGGSSRPSGGSSWKSGGNRTSGGFRRSGR
jgi:ATP-dependent RNA helicase RhlE